VRDSAWAGDRLVAAEPRDQERAKLVSQVVAGENGSLWVSDSSGFSRMREQLARELLDSPLVHVARWQQLDVSQSDAHATHELRNVTIWYDMPQNKRNAQLVIGPDLPWAEDHFLERVGGEPINPGVQHENWPYHAGQVDLHQHGGKYDHNYMERMWASKLQFEGTDDIDGLMFTGYRFSVGDLGTVVEQLRQDPTTRQAYLPIWFPEDTGAQQGQRVPCSLGYHFFIREGHLHVQYNLRSCEVYRHFTNDVYMAVRLGHWVREQIAESTPWYRMGQLTMHMISFHGFVGDRAHIEEMAGL
jgi:thymidylate synthase